MAIDPDGRLWVGTHSGVYAFDGQQWESYLASRSTRASRDLAADSTGSIWVASYDGLHVIENGQVQSVSTERFSSAVLVTDQDGQVWIRNSWHHGIAPVTERGPGESLPGAGAQSDLAVRGSAITFDSSGRMWIGAFDSLSAYDGERWQKHVPMPDLSITAITFDLQGRVWVSGHQSSLTGPFPCFLVTYDSEEWVSYPVPLPTIEKGPPFTTVSIPALAFDTRGRLWATFDTSHPGDSELSSGLGMYNGDEWALYETADAISPLSSEDRSGCRALLIDESGLLWVGVGSNIVSYDLQTALPAPDPVPDILLDRHRALRQVTRGSSLLAIASCAVAAWATYLNGQEGRSWAQQLRARADEMSETKRTSSGLPAILSALAGGVCFCAWLFLLRPLAGPQEIEQVSRMLTCLWPIYVVFGAGDGLIFYLGVEGMHRRRTPNQLVLGTLGVLLSLLLWLAFGVLTLFAIVIAAD